MLAARGRPLRARGSWSAVALLSAACNSPGVAGGTVVAPDSEPRGAVLGRWTLTACHTSGGAAYPDPDSEVRLVRTPAGALVLVEDHEGYDTLVVTNVSMSRGERVFQLALKRSSSGPSLREYCIPSDVTLAGRFAVVKDVRAWNDDVPKGGFTAKYTQATLACELRPVRGDAGAE
jgi:hypothetical protein